MKSNLLYKVFAIILSIPLIALIFGGCSGNLSESGEAIKQIFITPCRAGSNKNNFKNM